MRVTCTGARASILTANSPAKPPPTITTRRAPDPVVMSSPRRVVPGVAGRHQPACLLRAPASPGVLVHGHHVAEHRVYHAPGLLHRVLPREQPPVTVEGRADQPVVGPHVRPGLRREREFLRLRLPARARLLPLQHEADPRFRPDAEPERVRWTLGLDTEQVLRRVPEGDTDLGGSDRHALTRPDQYRHARPPPGVHHEPDCDEALGRRARVDSLHLLVSLVLPADRVLGRQRADRAYQP